MRADSPWLPGGGGTSAPSSGGGHVGPDHVIRRRNALEVKVHGVGGLRGGQTRTRKLRLATGLTTCWGRPLRSLPRPLWALRPSLGRPLVLPTTPRSIGP